MIQKKIQFFFEYQKCGIPWVLFIKIDGAERWAIAEWERAPKDAAVAEIKKICLRLLSFYMREITK